MTAIDGELGQQNGRQRIGLIALRRPWPIAALDLGRRQTDEAGDSATGAIDHDADTRGARLLIAPGVAAEPLVQGLSSAIESLSVIVGRERARGRYFIHAGGVAARRRKAGISLAGAAAQASNRSQSASAIVTTRR